jgi:hypothetical protein
MLIGLLMVGLQTMDSNCIWNCACCLCAWDFVSSRLTENRWQPANCPRLLPKTISIILLWSSSLELESSILATWKHPHKIAVFVGSCVLDSWEVFQMRCAVGARPISYILWALRGISLLAAISPSNFTNWSPRSRSTILSGVKTGPEKKPFTSADRMACLLLWMRCQN